MNGTTKDQQEHVEHRSSVTVTAQTPLTVEEVFDGWDFRTNEGREGIRYFFYGHLTADQVAETYYALYPEHRTEFPYTVDVDSVRHAWHVFTAHEDTCYLIAEADDDDPFEADDFFDSALCTCAAHSGLEDGTGYEYRHPHPAVEGQPGAIPVTWVSIPMGNRAMTSA